MFRLYQNRLPFYRQRVFWERSYQYDPNIEKVSGQVYLKGYWQSEKYFVNIGDLLREELSIIVDQDRQSQQVAEFINTKQSVSIHIRRGDYVTNPDINQIHGICDLDYYHRSVNIISERVANPYFFVFSDDPIWAAENLCLDYPTTFVTHNDVSRDFEDLRLMSMCTHHITANSSFSWWGAWLSNKSGTVIVPKEWFRDGNDYKNKDRWPSDWIIN
jgi:hypothetical protein